MLGFQTLSRLLGVAEWKISKCSGLGSSNALTRVSAHAESTEEKPLSCITKRRVAHLRGPGQRWHLDINSEVRVRDAQVGFFFIWTLEGTRALEYACQRNYRNSLLSEAGDIVMSSFATRHRALSAYEEHVGGVALHGYVVKGRSPPGMEMVNAPLLLPDPLECRVQALFEPLHRPRRADVAFGRHVPTCALCRVVVCKELFFDVSARITLPCGHVQCRKCLTERLVDSFGGCTFCLQCE